MFHLMNYKCSTCGESLRLDAEGKRAVCSYCGGEFFFKEDKSPALVMALNSANEHLKRNDFDNAIDQFNAAWKEHPTDAEAAWGVALSTYGIVYAHDDKTGNMVPTCSRIVKQSILENEAYLCAIRESVPEQREIYVRRANAIDRLQKKIKRAMEDEEDFDVFISFKAKDENGIPTEDSVIARKIYDELEKKGIKTFFSEVTLRDRLGDEFEPIIYRALYSCKFFILVATKEEYFNAAWVKNEWTRFRDRVAEEGLSGACTAVFKNISPYTLPRVFQNQGVELEKHPFDYANLIADNLENKLGLRPSAAVAAAPAASTAMQNESLFMLLTTNAFLSLGAGDFRGAEQSLNKAQELCPTNAEVYIGKLMIDLKVKKREDLAKQPTPFEDNPNYQKALKFGDKGTVATLKKYTAYIKQSIKHKEMQEQKAKRTLKITFICGVAALLCLAAVFSFVTWAVPVIRWKQEVNGALETIGLAEVGDIVRFGSLTQSEEPTCDLEWRVLAREEGRVLVILEYVLDTRQYHDNKSPNWEISTLREWLNQDFYERAFRQEEQEAIYITQVTNGVHPATEDRIFILSAEEVELYMPHNKYYFASGEGRSSYDWWLRTTHAPGSSAGIDICTTDGSIARAQYAATSNNIAVRPAMWVSISE